MSDDLEALRSENARLLAEHKEDRLYLLKALDERDAMRTKLDAALARVAELERVAAVHLDPSRYPPSSHGRVEGRAVSREHTWECDAVTHSDKQGNPVRDPTRVCDCGADDYNAGYRQAVTDAAGVVHEAVWSRPDCIGWDYPEDVIWGLLFEPSPSQGPKEGT